MAENLQQYRESPWYHRLLDIRASNFAAVKWSLYYRPDARDSSKRVKSWKHRIMKGLDRHKYFRKAVDTGELKEVENNPFLDVFHEPNPTMSGNTFRNLCLKYFDAQGEVFIYKRRDTLNIVYQLWLFSPTWIYKLPTESQPYFDATVLGRTVRIPAEDMVWIRNHELLNPYTRGAGQGESLGSFIDTDRYAREFMASFFYNDATPNGIWWLPQASQDTVDDFDNRINNAHKGSLRKHKQLILDGPVEPKFTQVNVSNGIDASIPLSEHLRDFMVSVMSVPPELAGILTSSNRATIEAAETIFARHVLIPLCEMFLDELSRQLLPDFDDRLMLAYENPVPADNVFKLDVMKSAPWIASAGEWREMAGLPSRGKEDEFYMVPVNLTPTPDASQPVIPMKPHNINDLQVAGTPNQPISNLVPSYQGTTENPNSGVTGGSKYGDEDEAGEIAPVNAGPGTDPYGVEDETNINDGGNLPKPGTDDEDLDSSGVKGRDGRGKSFKYALWEFLKAWDPNAHPRGPDGRFLGGGTSGNAKPGGSKPAPRSHAKPIVVSDSDIVGYGDEELPKAVEEPQGHKQENTTYDRAFSPGNPDAIASSSRTSAETGSLKSYVANGYLKINRDAVAGRISPSVKNLDSAISKSRLANDTMLYRGLSLPEDSSFSRLRPGDSFTERSFVSTTADRSIAEKFASPKLKESDESVVLRIKALGGTPAVNMHAALGGMRTHEEKEFLLGRETRFSVTKVVRDKGIRYIDVEVSS